jgi:predicted ABC-class ATPase
MRDAETLRATLGRIDGRGYKAYRDIAGDHRFDGLTLSVDHVQADPYAPPSRIRVTLDADRFRLPTVGSKLRRVALEDFLARRFRTVAGQTRQDVSRALRIDAGAQEVLDRSACRVFRDCVEFRLSVSLPARGRSILGRAAATLLVDELPRIAGEACTLGQLDDVEQFLRTVENAEALRGQLFERGLIAFVATDATLPRASGISDRPLEGHVTPFVSPPSLEVELERPWYGPARGMGIPEGVSVIVGGGFHGKSTLLRALLRGVYNHIPGDGRELVVTRGDAVGICAEDGRSVVAADFTGFISRLPLGQTTACFSTPNASGSTSQAANMLEAIESGSRLLLLDEDTCATNFMIRDRTMRALVPDEAEPITPFVDRVRELYDVHRVSTVLVMGGSGDYFDVADTVIWMNEFRPVDVTDQAKALGRFDRSLTLEPWNGVVHRVPDPSGIDPTKGRRTRVRARGTDEVRFGEDQIDVRQVQQIVDASQTRAIGEILAFAVKRRIIDGTHTISEVLDLLEEQLDDGGLETISPYQGHLGDLARPRRSEIAAALNRLRSLRAEQRR